jgi:transcriptional regulator of arginine metabolism
MPATERIMKAQRHAAILEIISQQEITSQEQLRSLLRVRQIETTQATLSRDIHELGLVKTPNEGAYRLATVPTPTPTTDARVRRAVEEYLRSIDTVEQLVVLKTDPGQAQALAIALDRSDLPEIVGTIAGDDTILVICRSAAVATSFVSRLDAMRRPPLQLVQTR